MQPTLRQAQLACQTHNCTLRKTGFGDELRVRHRYSREEYFTDDREDAIGTARVINANWERQHMGHA